MNKTTLIQKAGNYTSASGWILVGFLALPSVWADTATPGDYKIDPSHTSVNFTVSHLGTSDLTGRFNTVEGSFTLAPKGGSKVELTIATKSVDSNHEKRDTHLRGPDFFNVKQYPQIRFTSSKVSFNTEGLDKIEGSMSLHGKTQPVTFKVEPVGAGDDPWGGYRAGYNATTVIKRSDFGMDYMLGGIGDEISITLNIEAIKQ